MPERRPANGPYDGPAKVRVIPTGLSGSDMKEGNKSKAWAAGSTRRGWMRASSLARERGSNNKVKDRKWVAKLAARKDA